MLIRIGRSILKRFGYAFAYVIQKYRLKISPDFQFVKFKLYSVPTEYHHW